MRFLWSLALALALSAVEGNGNESSGGGSSTDGSNRCVWMQQSGKEITRFSAMPGGGWDNLRNKDMGVVADLSFTDCTLSDDGMYVMPRNVILYARKESTVESTSEIIEHYNNYTSSVSGSINVGTSGLLDALGIGGKLSEEYEQVKSVAVENRLKIGRSQLRYRLYSVKMQPDFKLSAALTSRLTDIVNALINNQTKMARYLSDLVVRDFGTHAVTSVEAGGILEKIDFFQSESVVDRDFMQNKFSASMSVTFHSLFGVNIGGGSTVTNEDIAKYQKSVRKLSVRSYGGPILGPNPKLADWMVTLKENLVPVDREGEPLYGVINRNSIPNVPLTHLLQLRKEIENAVLRYYKANTVKGCQDPNSANFDPVANIEGQCEAPVTNFTFAGVYQTCEESNPGLGMNLCGSDGGAQLHPATGGYSCPSGYEPVELLNTIGRSGRRCWERSHRCWLFFTCSDGEDCADSYTRLKAYWCVAKKGIKLETNSGMVFGGSYASDGRFVNEITKSKSCSEFFRPYQIGRDIQLCLSMDLQSAARYRIPFAGFFACNSGNPLADPKRGLVAATGAAAEPSEAPKRCPDGFSQVTLDTIDGCAVMQCVKGRSGISRILVRRPPFEEPDYELVESPVVRVESHGWRWGYNISSHAWRFLGYFGSGSSSSSSSLVSSSIVSSSIGRSNPVNGGGADPAAQNSVSGSTVAVALIGCLCGVTIVALIACYARRRGVGGSAIRRALCRWRSPGSLGQTNAGAEVAGESGASAKAGSRNPCEEDSLLGRSIA